MDNNTPVLGKEDTDLAADVSRFVEMYERLSPEDRTVILELLREINRVDS